MTHHNALGLPDPMDVRPDGLETFLDTLVVALATIAGVSMATLAATLVAPLAPGLGLVVVFVGWPLGFVVAVFALRLGHRAIVRSGLPAFVRDATRRNRPPKTVVTDGGRPDEAAENC